MTRFFLSSVLLLVLPAFLHAQSLDMSKKLDSYFETLEAQDKFMGSIAISVDNSVVYSKAVGYRDLEAGLRADTGSVYGIGSISKTFTAVLIFRAIEEGRLSLDTKLNVFFPEIKHSDEITILTLLNHSSGIHSFTDDEDYKSWYTRQVSGADLLKKIIDSGNDFRPQHAHQYSNANYVLLSLLLEKVFGRSYSELLQTYITIPLMLQSTRLGPSQQYAERYTKSYTHNGADWLPEEQTHPSVPIGAGAIVSTPADLLLFADALFSGRLLERESIEAMMTFSGGYGCGLFDMSYDGHRGVGHDGAIDGYRSILVIFPDDNISYAITSNASSYALSLITHTIHEAVFKNEVQLPRFQSVLLTESQIDIYTGRYSTDALPFKITIAREGLVLTAQAEGQALLPLEAVAPNVFTFDKAGIRLTFPAGGHTLVLSQGGQEFILQKEAE